LALPAIKRLVGSSVVASVATTAMRGPSFTAGRAIARQYGRREFQPSSAKALLPAPRMPGELQILAACQTLQAG